MKIAIIGPLCSGKSTLANDLAAQLKNCRVIEEAHRHYHDKGIDVAIAEKTTQQSASKLFNYSIKQVARASNTETIYIILGSPFDEFMYAYHAYKHATNTDLNLEYLLTLAQRAQVAMREFDLIIKIEDFQSIPYYYDKVRPDKDDSYRNQVNDTINEILSPDSAFKIIDDNNRYKIITVSGSREQRVKCCLNNLNQAPIVTLRLK